MLKLQTLLLMAAIAISSIVAQTKTPFQFETVVDTKVSPVKSQDKTGTCWSYSTVSFIESEILRLGGPELDLSEMYFVRQIYLDKAKRYIMQHGLANFSEGGQAHDVMNAYRKIGAVTELDFPGRCETEKSHNHSEMVSMLSIILKEYVDAKKPTPSPRWLKAQEAILDLYLGKVPAMVNFGGKEVKPTEWLGKYKFNPDDYVELTSYMHHPWYKTFDLEVPDNWSHDQYYNLPLDELMEVMHHSLNQGYSFVWDGDVSDPHFNHRMGAAFVPLTDTLGFVPQKERHITQQERQDAFLSWKSTDDHLMHVTGLSKDKEGSLFFKTKNSWGIGNNPFGGYLFMSESYMRLNTVAIMVHKDAIPKHIAKKLFQK